MLDYYLKLKNRQLSPEQKDIENKIIEFIQNKYSVKVHACLFNFDNSNNPILISVNILLKTEFEVQQLINNLRKKEDFYFEYPEEGKFISLVFEHYNIPISTKIKEGSCISYCSFEKCALKYCYSEAFEEIKEFREKHFNPKKMEKMGYNELFITYKSKKIMDESQKNGEQQYLINEFYKLIKKYDEHNFITKEKGLVYYFDYSNIALHPREYCELFWQRMTQPINECAVIKENRLDKPGQSGDGSMS